LDIQHATDLVLYAHLERGSLNPQLTQAPSGATVKAGDFLGLADNSGNSSGPHLHIHAIKGTQPWQGPPRPLLFREINVIDRSAINPPDPSGPWVTAAEQALPSVDALIWPSPTKPIHFGIRSFYEAAIDPLVLVLAPQVYIKLTLPDPAPIEVWTREVRELVRGMTPEERAAAKARVKALGEQVRVLERVFER
jgi:hypothetical protein